MNKIPKGTLCEVLEDNLGFFLPGEKVVTLETDEIPYCVRQNAYMPDMAIGEYGLEDFNPLRAEELKIIGCNTLAKA